MNKIDIAIYKLLSNAGPLRALELLQALNIGFSRLYPALHRLKKNGYVEAVQYPVNKSRLYYRLTGKEIES
jgi:DNA-binding PadR family transcriptional regulator